MKNLQSRDVTVNIGMRNCKEARSVCLKHSFYDAKAMLLYFEMPYFAL